jgi:hypothetical protein
MLSAAWFFGANDSAQLVMLTRVRLPLGPQGFTILQYGPKLAILKHNT